MNYRLTEGLYSIFDVNIIKRSACKLDGNSRAIPEARPLPRPCASCASWSVRNQSTFPKPNSSFLAPWQPWVVGVRTIKEWNISRWRVFITFHGASLNFNKYACESSSSKLPSGRYRRRTASRRRWVQNKSMCDRQATVDSPSFSKIELLFQVFRQVE